MYHYLSVIVNNGGGRGIRTPAGFDSPVGFQDRSLQPDLGIPPWHKNNSTILKLECQQKITWGFHKCLTSSLPRYM